LLPPLGRDDKLRLCPEQAGILLEALAFTEFTVTATEAEAVHPPETVTVTV
jgi:hypothetical protein